MSEKTRKLILASVVCAAAFYATTAQAGHKTLDPEFRLQICLEEAIQAFEYDDEDMIAVVDGAASSKRVLDRELIEDIGRFLVSCIRQLNAEAGDFVDTDRFLERARLQRVASRRSRL